MIAVSRYFTYESCIYFCHCLNMNNTPVSFQTDVYKQWEKRFLPIFRNFSYELTSFLRTRYFMALMCYLDIFVIRKKILNNVTKICRIEWQGATSVIIKTSFYLLLFSACTIFED